MTQYFIRRLLLVFPTFLGITVLVFTITRFVPGGPIERMIAAMQQVGEGQSGGASDATGSSALSADQMAQLEEYYGFDKPILQSYFEWLWKVVNLDLGESTRFGDPVWDVIVDKLPVSTYFGLMTVLLTYLICVPLGVFKAIKHASIFDSFSSIMVFMGYAVPGFVVGVLLLMVFSVQLEWFPLGGFVSTDFEDLEFAEKVWDLLKHTFLPLCAYMAGSFATMTLLMKNSLMDNLAADYVRTAISKGLPFGKAVLRHAFKNSLIPLATHFGNNISLIITGSFLIEFVFNIDGFGLLGFEAVVERDYPVVMGILVISSVLQLTGNILSDVCVALVDPRVQFK
ncbi:ABC transporter permease subunit [Oligoflexaceae bacterium]|nr:ABC transporter permease subunit [Oligoflexaceae bacterium]